MAQVKEQSAINFENRIDPDSIRYLDITKKLYSDKAKSPAKDITDSGDKAKFSFRLYLSNGTGNELEYASWRKYYVVKKDPDNNIFYYCKWNTANQNFDVTGDMYGTVLTKEKQREYTFNTSMNGSISNIPAGYTVRVPGLLVGTKFYVEERDYETPIGYELIDYTCVNGTKTQSGTTTDVPSYTPYRNGVDGELTIDGKQTTPPTNSAGTVIAGQHPAMEVNNHKGYGLKAEKIWSDSSYADYHDDIHTAVYVGDTLLPNTVKTIESPYTTVTYFFDDLVSGENDLSNYKVYEVLVEGNIVTKKLDLLSDRDELKVKAGRSSTDNIESDYKVSYPDPATDDPDVKAINDAGNQAFAKKTLIKNTRKGGISINLYKWYTETDKDTPLPNGEFTLYKVDGTNETILGKYTSDSTGNVTVLYGFTQGETYRIKETKAPAKYKGLTEPITFTLDLNSTDVFGNTFINDNDKDEDGNRLDNDGDVTDGRNWAEYSYPGGDFKAKIDIYNKQYTLEIRKVDSVSGDGVGGAKFNLYACKDTQFGLIRDSHPYIDAANNTYKDLESKYDDNGAISKDLINEDLPAGKYFLVETEAPSGYDQSKLSKDLLIEITEQGTINIIGNMGENVKEVDNADKTSIIYEIRVPNEKLNIVNDYYFNIEKTILVDKNIHNDDKEQKFVFKVDRFEETETIFLDANIKESFFVTLNCDIDKSADFSIDPSTDNKYTFGSGQVTIDYDSDSYIFPAGVWKGIQSVKVKQKGKYRVSEVSKWSSTDYDFWKGSQKYITKSGSSVTENTGYIDDVAEKDPYVIFAVGDTDNVKNGCASVSFTNCESEYAYLSSQAYAENTINKPTTP